MLRIRPGCLSSNLDQNMGVGRTIDLSLKKKIIPYMDTTVLKANT